MEDFAKLKSPTQNLSIGKATWLVETKKTINCYWYCLLSDGSNELIAPFANTETDTYIFDTKLEAYCASMAYYHSHGHGYPYFDEYEKERKVENVVSTSQHESQVMRFN